MITIKRITDFTKEVLIGVITKHSKNKRVIVVVNKSRFVFYYVRSPKPHSILSAPDKYLAILITSNLKGHMGFVSITPKLLQTFSLVRHISAFNKFIVKYMTIDYRHNYVSFFFSCRNNCPLLWKCRCTGQNTQTYRHTLAIACMAHYMKPGMVLLGNRAEYLVLAIG